MYNFKKLTPVNGFDESSLDNARQNNYAWSMTEMDGYIYVGTGRNLFMGVIGNLGSEIKLPLITSTNNFDSRAEIWRYKKDGSLPWQRVCKSKAEENLMGFRYLINRKDENGSQSLYAAGSGAKIVVYKSINGVTWIPLDNTSMIGGTSRAMASLNNKLYLAVAEKSEFEKDAAALLYSSIDPEFYPWVLETPLENDENNKVEMILGKNPRGTIYNMAAFNNKLYVACITEEGIAIWRTNGPEPKVNDWTLVVDKGFGDSANDLPIGMGEFRGKLYVSGSKALPYAWAIPMGADMISIDKEDNWELIVGGLPIKPSKSTKGKRGLPASGLLSGFNNPFNVYIWQILEYKGKLVVGTFDDSVNMRVWRDTFLVNKELFNEIVGEKIADLIIELYNKIIYLLNEIKYSYGFDLYESTNGKTFRPIFLNGLGNPYNYGSRMLMVDSDNDLYIGTANPFQGCEVWREGYVEDSNDNSIYTPMTACKNSYNYVYNGDALLEKYKDEFNKCYNELVKYIGKCF